MAREFMTIDRRKLDNLARRGSAVIVAQTTQRTVLLARSMAPGSMKDKIRPIVTGGANPLGIVMVDHPAASFVLNGTRPHVITPRKKGGVLRFEVNGRTVYARLVHHPGTKPNNFLLKALRAARM